MFHRTSRNDPTRNLGIKAFEEAEAGHLFFFNNEDSRETHVGAMGYVEPVVGTDSSFLNSLQAVLSGPFPAGTLVQWAQLGNQDVGDIINEYELSKARAKPVYRALAKAHADLFRSGRDKALIPLVGTRMHRRRVYFGIKIPIKGMSFAGDEAKEVTSLIDKVFLGLEAAQLHFRRLNQDQYRELVASVHNPFAAMKDLVADLDETRTLDQQILPIGTSIKYGLDRKQADIISFNDGEYFARVLSVNNFPRMASPWIMNDVVGHPGGTQGQISGPFYVTMTMLYVDPSKGKRRVAIRKQQIDSQYSEAIVKFVPRILDEKRGVDVLSDEIERRGGVMVDVNLTMVVYARTESELDKTTATLLTYYPTLGGEGRKFQVKADKRVLQAVFEQGLPLNGTAKGYGGSLYRLHAMGVRHALCFAPLYGDHKFPVSGEGSLVLTRRGEPALINIFESTGNYNGCVFAAPGSGKTVAIQQMILDLLASGARVWAIDDGKSLEKTADYCGAQYLVFRPNEGICLNPFTRIPRGGLDEEMALLKTLIAKMAAPNDGLSDEVMAHLEPAIQQVFQTHGNRTTITDLAAFLANLDNAEAKQLALQLFPFTRNGQYGAWFNGEANVDFNADFIILEMGELKPMPHLRDVIALQTFALINRGMTALGDSRAKVMLVEEAKQWLLDPIMSQGIDNAFARARKDNGSAILVTQSLMDVKNSPHGSSILANTAWKLILKQNPEAIEEAVKEGVLKLSAYEKRVLESVHTIPGHYSEFMFFNSEGHHGVYRLVLSPFVKIMLSSRDEERYEVRRLMASGLSAAEAITRFMRDRGIDGAPPGIEDETELLAA